MSVAPILSTSTNSRITDKGKEIIMDCKIMANNLNLQENKSFGGNVATLTAMDRTTRYLFGDTIKGVSNKDILPIVEQFRLQILNQNRLLKTIRTDNKLITIMLKNWAMQHNITLLPCIPHEHFQIGDIERFHRSLQDSIVKNLYDKEQLCNKYWGLAYKDILFKNNILPHSTNHTTTPYEEWFGKKVDLKNTPMLPFGTLVNAHIPLQLQQIFSGRAIETIAVGCAEHNIGGIQLFNPKTKRIIIRRTFKALGDKKLVSKDFNLPIEFESLADIDDKTIPQVKKINDSDTICPTKNTDNNNKQICNNQNTNTLIAIDSNNAISNVTCNMHSDLDEINKTTEIKVAPIKIK